MPQYTIQVCDICNKKWDEAAGDVSNNAYYRTGWGINLYSR